MGITTVQIQQENMWGNDHQLAHGTNLFFADVLAIAANQFVS